MKQLASPTDPLVLANGIMIDPQTGLPIDAVAVPNAVDAIKAVTKTRLKLADLPAPPAQMNPVAVVLMYRMIGLSNKDIAIAIGISVKQVENLQKTDIYSRLQDTLYSSIQEAAQDDVRTFMAAHSKQAAQKVATLAQNGPPRVALRASIDILDRTGHRPVDVHEHRIKQDSTLRIEYVESPNDIPVVDLAPEEYKDGDGS